MYSLDWSRVYGLPQSTAHLKCVPEDFQVNEFFDTPFSGQGEHILLRIEKSGLNTEEVVKSLASLIHKPVKMISYAGLKDRQALTTQWLSVHAPGEEIPGIEQLSAPGWRVLECTRHHKKLKPGFLTGNQFIIRLRDLTDEAAFLQRVEAIKKAGVPNYFGEQRFGHDAGNLSRAEEMLVQGRKVKDRFRKGMYCSAARSWIFNLILAHRVSERNWNTPLTGDVMQLSGSKSIFVIDEVQEELMQRIRDKDISPASPLPGKSKHKVQGEASALIDKIYADWQPWLAGLERVGLEEAWRANILHVEQFDCVIQDKVAELSFILPAGSYATAVLRELVLY
ncbi:tRNA pseudouridine(13) synthase TruD [Legionella rowbothamii]|uniref:tRNA pseudouridine(13) synthase TruD n=1 Tax=Legionella rowbothamii TaxID=96229 RepID=UPI001054C96E|nr:tRNA pseudouridine(13) synthase TruD [Legionella rowbothamii]